jgi:lysozyme family protein
MPDFEPAYRYLKKLEGHGVNLGYVNLPSDRGGETIGGISRRWNPVPGIWGRVEVMKSQPDFPACLETDRELPILIEDWYRFNPWQEIKGDQLLNQDVANQVFEFHVHAPPGVSAKALQLCLNLLNYYGRLYDDIKVDGGIGTRETIPALALALASRNGKQTLLNMMNVEQGHYYNVGGGSGRPQEENIRGFYRRVEIRNR